MKLAYVVRQIDASGGRERVVVNKANYFVDKGVEVTIVTMFQQNAASFFDLDRRVRVHHLRLQRPESFHGGRFKYRKYVKDAIGAALRRFSPDVTISLWWGIEFRILPSIKDGSRKIVEFHFSQYMRSLLMSGSVSWYFKLRVLFSRWLEAMALRRYDALVVLTDEDRPHWNHKQVVVIPNALSFVLPEASDCSSHTVMTVGRLTEQKGFDRLISIWAAIEPDYPGWRLFIWGDGEDKAQLLQMIAEKGLKAVSIMPATRQIKDEMLKASIFTLTSRYEGAPMVLTEAMQCGLPIVSYDTRCGPRDLIDDEVSGYIVKEGDERAFAERLRTLMDNEALRVRMGAAAKRLSVSKFGQELVMGKWKELLERTVTQGRV
jgi:glycosyltransferase involved in cell wall biosynthesis